MPAKRIKNELIDESVLFRIMLKPCIQSVITSNFSSVSQSLRTYYKEIQTKSLFLHLQAQSFYNFLYALAEFGAKINTRHLDLKLRYYAILTDNAPLTADWSRRLREQWQFFNVSLKNLSKDLLDVKPRRTLKHYFTLKLNAFKEDLHYLQQTDNLLAEVFLTTIFQIADILKVDKSVLEDHGIKNLDPRSTILKKEQIASTISAERIRKPETVIDRYLLYRDASLSFLGNNDQKNRAMSTLRVFYNSIRDNKEIATEVLQVLRFLNFIHIIFQDLQETDLERNALKLYHERIIAQYTLPKNEEGEQLFDLSDCLESMQLMTQLHAEIFTPSFNYFIQRSLDAKRQFIQAEYYLLNRISPLLGRQFKSLIRGLSIISRDLYGYYKLFNGHIETKIHNQMLVYLHRPNYPIGFFNQNQPTEGTPGSKLVLA